MPLPPPLRGPEIRIPPSAVEAEEKKEKDVMEV